MAIPYITLSTEGAPLNFAHANGYPPEAYAPFLEHFTSQYQVTAPYLRPLWPDSNLEELVDWGVLGHDLLNFLEIIMPKTSPAGNKVIGLGHSVGATSTLMAALNRPELFAVLVLVEPVLFLPWKRTVWRIVTKLGLQYRLHPLIRGSLKRRSHFPNREAMYENYRTKAVFRRISDHGLHAYVNALACEHPNDGVTLTYTPQWETRIYATAGLHDPHIWRNAPRLKTPTLLIQGADTASFGDRTAHRLLNRLPNAKLVTIPQTGHLAPLEAPEKTFEVINEFLEQKFAGSHIPQIHV